DFGTTVALCGDGGFILGGATQSWGTGGDAYIVRTNASGGIIWTKYFGSAESEEAVSVVFNNDDTYAFAVRDSTANADVDVRVIKTSGDGTFIWDKTYGASEKDTPKSIRKTSDGGYIIGAI